MKTFKDYIHNKTIALVGPAKYMENTNLGSEIDNHDVVIRINRGIELNNTEHIGSKSDILYSCLIEKPENAGKIDTNYLLEKQVNLICCPPKSSFNGISYKSEFSDLVDVNKMKKVSDIIPIRIINHTFHTELAHEINCRPNTGFLAIYDILNQNPKKLSLYGFSFYLDGFMEGCKSGINMEQKKYVDKCFESKRHNQKNMWEYAKQTLKNNPKIYLDPMLKRILNLKTFNRKNYNKKISDSDVKNVLAEDGLPKEALTTFHQYENITTVNLDDLRSELGMTSWAVRIAYNDRFGGVVIQQQTGEGNRKHYHPHADENWVILDGEWEWWIEGKGTQIVKKHDIIVVPKNTWHHIKCTKGPGVRYAVTQPDVEHVYEE